MDSEAYLAGIGRSVRSKAQQLGRSLRIALPVSDRRILLLLGDVLVINGAVLAALRLWAWVGKFPFTPDFVRSCWLWFTFITIAWVALAWLSDLYDIPVAARPVEAIGRIGIVMAGLMLLYLVIYFVSPRDILPRLFFLFFVGVASVGMGLWRWSYAVVFRLPPLRRRVLIVGAGWAGRTIAQAMAEHSDGTYQVVGFVDDDPAKQHSTFPVSRFTFSVLGNRHALPSLVRQHSIDTLILAITHGVDGELLQTMMDCLELGVEIIPMPVLYEQLTGRVPIEHVGSNWYVAMPIHHPLTRPLTRLMKRIFDIVGATLGLIVLAVMFPFIALAIYVDSPGPIFYTQERVGQGGRIFRLYKFRSMVPDAEEGRVIWAQENDPRVTRVGRILRKTHIDEFPQFINILKGEMSAVGPRPERPEFVEELAREIPFYRVRHAVKPGMAGWALVKYGYASSKEDTVIKLQYDLYYIKHWSIGLDLGILLKTGLDMLTLRGRA